MKEEVESVFWNERGWEIMGKGGDGMRDRKERRKKERKRGKGGARRRDGGKGVDGGVEEKE